MSLTDAGIPADERDFLERIERGSVLACPIPYGDRIWGVLEAYSAAGAPPFSAAHVRFAEALCAQVATAIGRAELFSRLETLAYEDPLTRLPNRRALDVRLEEAVARAEALDGELALLFCDLDALKEVNDLHGHAAGDRALIATGAALSAAAEAYPGSFTSRLGGDEFCVLLEGHGADAARALAREAGERLATVPGGPFAFSCGVAVLDAEHRHAGDLFRAADAAQYAAKRVGGGSVFVAEPGLADPAPEPASRRRFRDARPDDREALVRGVLDVLDGDLAEADAALRLEAVAVAFAGHARRGEVGDLAPRARRRDGRDRVRGRAQRGPLQRRGRGVPARRLPADRGDPRARRRLRRRRRRRCGRPRRARAARRVGPRVRARRRRGSTATAPAGSSSCSGTGTAPRD